MIPAWNEDCKIAYGRSTATRPPNNIYLTVPQDSGAR